jgi:hypothetical protein
VAPLGLQADSLGWVIMEERQAGCSEFAGLVEVVAVVVAEYINLSLCRLH